MQFVETRNVGSVLSYMGKRIREIGVPRDSRNGKVLVVDGPLTTLYHSPTERVIFDPVRDANPFFHFMEGLWMLSGRNDVAWIGQFNSTFHQFSDDGETFHSAYGYRWINHFAQKQTQNLEMEEFPGAAVETYVPMNQLEIVAEMLKANPDERRALVTMWSPEDDLGAQKLDLPCNLMILFSISVHGHLDMTVYNRSNDMIWGAYGANAVHMSMLQEYMAARIGVPVGRYWQVANNFHGYESTLEKVDSSIEEYKDPYSYEVCPYPMVNTDIETWGQELAMFMSRGPVIGFQDKFFKNVASPIWLAWFAWKGTSEQSKRERIEAALVHARSIKATDWRKACVEWLERRA